MSLLETQNGGNELWLAHNETSTSAPSTRRTIGGAQEPVLSSKESQEPNARVRRLRGHSRTVPGLLLTGKSVSKIAAPAPVGPQHAPSPNGGSRESERMEAWPWAGSP